MPACEPPVQQLQCPVTAADWPPWSGIDVARKELSGVGQRGREGEVKRAEKRWRTTEIGQQRKDRKKENCRTMKQIHM